MSVWRWRSLLGGWWKLVRCESENLGNLHENIWGDWKFRGCGNILDSHVEGLLKVVRR